MFLMLFELTTKPRISFRAVWTEKGFVGEMLQSESCLTTRWSRKCSSIVNIKTETTAETIGRKALEHLAIKWVKKHINCAPMKYIQDIKDISYCLIGLLARSIIKRW